MGALGTVKERTYELIEQGEYVLTLNDIEASTGQYGDSLIWKWLIAPVGSPDAYICRSDGEEKRLFTFTDQDIIIGSQAHEFAQTLSGRTLEKDDAPPEDNELLGRRLIAYVTHYTPKQGKNAGKKKEQIVAGSVKPFKGKHATVAPLLERPEKTDAEVERADLVLKVEKLIGRAVKFGTENHLLYAAMDLGKASDADLEQVAADVQKDIDAFMDS